MPSTANWTYLYNRIGPASINPWTSVEIYGKGGLGTQWYRLQAANKSNLDDLTATLNKDLLIKAEREISAKKRKIDNVLKQVKKEKNPKLREAAQKALREEKRKLTKFGTHLKKEGKKLIRKQEKAAVQEYKDMKKMGGLGHLGYRPDYQALQPPAMKGWLVDIYGTYSGGLGQFRPRKVGILEKAAKRTKNILTRITKTTMPPPEGRAKANVLSPGRPVPGPPRQAPAPPALPYKLPPRHPLSLGQIFSPPNYGQLLPASYQAEPPHPYGSGNPYAADGDLYTQPWYYSYWRYLLPGRQLKLP